MPSEVKIQLLFAFLLAMELLGLYMIIIRTVASLEYACNRIEDIVEREVQLSWKWLENQRVALEKEAQNADARGNGVRTPPSTSRNATRKPERRLR